MLLLSKSVYKRWARLELPVALPQDSYALCAALLDDLRKQYVAHFPGNEFYVLFSPQWQTDRKRFLMLDELKKRGMRLLNAEDVYGSDAWQLYYPLDFHPLPKANELLAKWFWETTQPSTQSH